MIRVRGDPEMRDFRVDEDAMKIWSLNPAFSIELGDRPLAALAEENVVQYRTFTVELLGSF